MYMRYKMIIIKYDRLIGGVPTAVFGHSKVMPKNEEFLKSGLSFAVDYPS